MATVDTLLVRIEADMRGLRRDLASVQRQTTATTRRMSQGFQNTQKSTVDLGASLGRLRGILAGLGIAVFGRSVVKANAEMEDLRSTLSTVFGTAERGEAAFAFINEFAQRTPFDIQTLSRAFIQLRGAGIAPTEKMLTTLGNAASTTTDATRSFEAMVRLLQRSMGGGLGIEELEILQNAGLPVFTILEEKLNITRLEVSKFGQTTEGAAKITQALMDHFDSASPDAMANRSKNLSVQLSNLGIAANNALLQMGDAGLNEAIKTLVTELTNVLQVARPAIEAIGRGLGGAVQFLAENLRIVTVALASFLATMVIGKIVALTVAVVKLTRGFILLGSAIKIINTLLKRTPLGLLAIALGVTAEKLGLIDKAFKALGLEVGSVSKEIDGVNNGLKELENTMNSGTAATQKKQTGLSSFDETMKKLKASTRDAKLELQGFNAEQRAAILEGIESGRVKILSEGTPQEVMQMDPDAANQLDQIAAQVQARDELRKKLEEQQRAINNAKSAVTGLITEEEKLIQVKRDLVTALQAGKISQQEFKDATEATNQAIFQQSEVGIATMNAIGQVSSSVSQGIADVITNSGEGLKSFKETFRDITNSIIKQLIETKIQAMLTSQALSFGGSIFGGGGGGGGFSLGSIFSGIGSFFGFGGGGSSAPTPPPLPNIIATATGSSVVPRQSFLVGERGPELFTPNVSGMITPNNMVNMAMSGGQTLRGGGGANITQNFNVTTGVTQTVRAEILNLMPLIRQESINAVIDARSRGGALASGLGA